MITIEGVEKYKPFSKWWRRSPNVSKIVEGAYNHVRMKLGYYPILDVKVIFVKDKSSIHWVSNGKHYSSGSCPRNKGVIYISARDATKEVLRHELGHYHLNHLLGDQRVSSNFHEAVAQYTEEDL